MVQRKRGTVSTEGKKNSGYGGLVEHWIQRTSGTVGTEDKRNSGHRGRVEQWV